MKVLSFSLILLSASSIVAGAKYTVDDLRRVYMKKNLLYFKCDPMENGGLAPGDHKDLLRCVGIDRNSKEGKDLPTDGFSIEDACNTYGGCGECEVLNGKSSPVIWDCVLEKYQAKPTTEAKPDTQSQGGRWVFPSD
ncbi:hypothetical protein O9K51_07215 [Purpureocillium lavendulum]|uniref:Uncharacterized protein n=1 Tax=Purpureocillium lavendulum TaxID=1247861 RepID=A0AB34FJE7_9HYPO|nr:hypothetical protein O9K51_07215 [Purpureocillium lavendulum]